MIVPSPMAVFLGTFLLLKKGGWTCFKKCFLNFSILSVIINLVQEKYMHQYNYLIHKLQCILKVSNVKLYYRYLLYYKLVNLLFLSSLYCTEYTSNMSNF